MIKSAIRQIIDIQRWAERLLNDRPSMDDIDEFRRYNEELKLYLLNNLSDGDLLEYVSRIPEISITANTKPVTQGFLSALLVTFTSAFVAYFHEQQRIAHAQETIRDIRSAYATLEFLTRARQ